MSDDRNKKGMEKIPAPNSSKSNLYELWRKGGRKAVEKKDKE